MPKPRKKKSKIYFGTPAQEAIIEYNNSKDPKERSRIYEERIKYPFEKLSENILNTFKFSYFDIPKEDVKKESCFYDDTKNSYVSRRPSRAFLYFSIIAKNYLILINNGNYKDIKKQTYYLRC